MAKRAEILDPAETGELLSDLQIQMRVAHLGHLATFSPLQTEKESAVLARDKLLPELETRVVPILDVVSIKSRGARVEKQLNLKPIK